MPLCNLRFRIKISPNLTNFCHNSVTYIKGALLVRDNRVFNGPLGRSLLSFARTAHSLCIAPLISASFMGSLTHFAHSLVRQFKFMNTCSRCQYVWQGETRFWSSVQTPKVALELGFANQLTTQNTFLPIERVFSVNRYLRISSVPGGSEQSEWASPWKERVSIAKRSTAKRVSGVVRANERSAL